VLYLHRAVMLDYGQPGQLREVANIAERTRAIFELPA
jgi:hypothetical protein